MWKLLYENEFSLQVNKNSANKTQVVEMDWSRSTCGTKPKPTCGTDLTDLGTKREKEPRTAEGNMEEDGGKGTR